ncbi:carotenoid 1,2-hydratase [Dermatobacter hominis]|uniref:carotenoid 1,2-hydratase n=1 Tax=Dermatobacter hominis TaxID=2884263 RepID=UPI001D10FE8C|nr:carotenoid 1,2-hydratase [Dermatobacter hominis]UDY36582.1 carotenoid 1,2-hydratase [Dermatobacter hominis]
MTTTRTTQDPSTGTLDESTLQDTAHLLGLDLFDPSRIDPGTLATLTSRRNSPEEIATRMRRYLQHLLENPVSHVPDRSELWRTMLEHCDRLTPLQAYVMRNLMGSASNMGYDPMPSEVHLEFPRDDQVDLGAQVGWHFLVGSLWDADGNEYGIEFMLFEQAMFPPDFAKEVGLSPLDNLAVEVQFAISTRGDRHHQAEPLVTLGTSGLVRTNASPFSFSVGINSFESAGRDGLLPMRVRATGLDLGGDEPLALACDLRLDHGKGVLEQGDHGAMPSVAGVGTFYYSVPAIQLAAETGADGEPTSTISIDGRVIPIVRGELWFDHQWGFLSGMSTSEVIRASNSIGRPDPSGWDWFMTHLVGDRQVTMFAPHRSDFAAFYGCTGEDPPPEMVRRVGGTYMDADGATRMVWGTVHVDRWVKVEHTPRPDRYPATHTWHPDHYRFEFEDLPDDIATFTLTPIVEGGQSAFFANGVQICEGAVVVRDSSGTDIGRGFAEAVAFSDTLRDQLRLAGLPDDDATVALAAEPIPSPELAAANAAFVADHQDELARIVAEAKGLQFFMDPDPAPPAG